MRVKGVEPPRQRRQILSLVRLPISPHPRLLSFTIYPGECAVHPKSGASASFATRAFELL